MPRCTRVNGSAFLAGAWLKSLAPSNPVAAAAGNAILPLVIFALFGFAAGLKTMLGTAKQMAANQQQSTQAEASAGTEGK